MGDETPKTLRLVGEDNVAIDVPVDEAASLLTGGRYRVETGADVANRAVSNVEEEAYGGVLGGATAVVAGALRSGTAGGSDVLFAGLGEGKHFRKLREHNPTLSAAGEIGGAILPVGAGGLAARAGARVAGTGGGAAAQVFRATKGAATEGGIMGLGQGVSEVALSDKPLSIEQAFSTIGSNVLGGAVTGGVVGGVGKGIGLGLRKAKGKLDDIVARPQVADDALKVEQRAQVADEIKALRSEMKEQKIWLATKDADVKAIREVREVGKIALEADRAVDRMLRNPKALAKRPERVLDGLQQQEHALETLVNQREKLAPVFAADKSGARAAALDYAEVALQKNRALQAKIGELTAKPVAQAAAATGGIADMATDAAIGYGLSQVAGIDPMIGAAVMAARRAAPLLKKLGANQAAVAERGSKAISALLDVGERVGPRARLAAPVLASKVLGESRYAQEDGKRKAKDAKPSAPPLATSYKARSQELRSQVAPTPDGKVQMRPEARARVAEQLAPIRAADPILADRLETMQAKKLEFLASKLPRKPDPMAMQVGPDRWQPSDMEMRAFARYASAVEDPTGVVERLADGAITPEDVEAMKEVYPEMHADIVQQVIAQLPSLRKTLPYQRRLALSMFTGVPVDPTMDPRVLSVLQASFANEEGTEGGTMAPKAQPAFGSVTKPEPTAAQQRGA